MLIAQFIIIDIIHTFTIFMVNIEHCVVYSVHLYKIKVVQQGMVSFYYYFFFDLIYEMNLFFRIDNFLSSSGM